MKTQSKRLLLAAVPLLFTLGCDLKTSIDYDRAADFSSVKTYVWADIERNPEVNDLVHRRILDAVNAELRAKGLTLDDTNPDVAITYFGDHDEQTVIDTMHHGYGYGYDWYYGGLGTGMSSSTSTVRTYKQGTLVIDIYKVSDKRLMWRGAVTGTVSDDPQKNEQKLNKGITKLFLEYPPPPSG